MLKSISGGCCGCTRRGLVGRDGAAWGKDLGAQPHDPSFFRLKDLSASTGAFHTATPPTWLITRIGSPPCASQAYHSTMAATLAELPQEVLDLLIREVC